jgi:AcrR family transcriptional regulator
LLAAARAVFAKKGYDSATVSEIVGRAGVAQGTFYLYFPGKESLAGAFAEELAERFAELAHEKARTAPSREWLERFIRHWQKQGAIDPKARPAMIARLLRDGIDRAAKSYILFGDRNYGRDLAELLRRGLSPR